MTRRKRAPLSLTARAVLREVVRYGEPAPPDVLLPVVRGSWHRLADSLSVLAGRGLVRIRQGFVLATSDGRAAVGGEL